uniref:Uncharacterized protein n=1 Tax=Schizophyllum commune (strain H4-8 / FGSC 9210) TaxID=578458 RepID=D8PTW0_SCHCM
MPFLSPIPGSYAVISLDPVASYKGLNDPIVAEACQKISCGKYIACLTQLNVSLQPVNMMAMALRYCPYRIDLVVEGLPPDDPDRFYHHAMSLPILPNSLHPMDRRPIQATPPLPWDGCYHAVHYHAKSQKDPQSYLSLEEADILDRYILHDDGHALAQERARDAGSGASFPPVPEISNELRIATKHSTPNTSTPTPWWLLESSSSTDSGESASSDSHSEFFDTPSGAECSSATPLGTSEDVRVMEMIFSPAMRAELLPVVQFSYDLTEFDRPPDPSGFFQELSQLKRILADYDQRKEQKRAELLKQDDEYYSRLRAEIPQSKAPTRLRQFIGRVRDVRAHDLMTRLREVCRVNPYRLRLHVHVQRGHDGTRLSTTSFLIRVEIVNLTGREPHVDSRAETVYI